MFHTLTSDMSMALIGGKCLSPSAALVVNMFDQAILRAMAWLLQLYLHLPHGLDFYFAAEKR